MKPGDVLLTPVPQADGRMKNRPVIFLREMRPFGDALVCGISTQLQQEVHAFDERITHEDADFAASGLVADSLIRLGFLAVVPQRSIIGTIGSISPMRLRRLLQRLSRYLVEET